MGHLPSRPSAVMEKSLTEVLAKNEVVHVDRDFVIVTPRRSSDTALQLADASVQDRSQLGVSGATLYSQYLLEDYNPELRGMWGILQYNKMKKSDSDVRKSLRIIKTPVLAARWYIQAAARGEDDEVRPFDKMIADFVWENLTEKMSNTWWQIINECLYMLDYGYYIFEKVWAFDSDGRVILKKLAPIHPIDVIEWVYDDEGGPDGVKVSLNDRPWERFISIDKLAVFTFDREANKMTGTSVLRSAYKHWYFKEQLYKIDAIQKERHGIGIPVITLPPGFTTTDKNLAHEMGRNLRTNEKAHIVLPPNWKLEFAKIEGNPVNALESAEHHSAMILGNVMADFLGGKNGGESGIDSQWEIFQKGTAFIGEIIRDVFNKWVIPDIVDKNWRTNAYPQLRVRRIGDTTDWRTISFAMRNFIGAKALTPDDEMEKWIRDEMDLPKMDPDSFRESETPQAPGTNPQAPNVGPPRQSQAANQRTGTGSSNVGEDRSGG